MEARETIQALLNKSSEQCLDEGLLQECSFKLSDVELALPVYVRDFTDMQGCKNHAYNLGIIRGRQPVMNPNWTSMCVGYVSRASSIVGDGTDIVLPRG